MSDIATTVHEAYAFACMRCGYGWEQSYEIEHHVDASQHAYVVYKADGERVPSPLSTPTCGNCGGHVVRIMRAGRVSTVQQLLRNPDRTRPAAGPLTPEEPREEPVAATAVPAAGHHWHFSDLLHPFRK
ncbi:MULTISPECIES: hypothetical protein [unclassified Streptomyces]|uniref:hypothetical protein n=1 Tax=unclassified Streptomyces TaxID=2593676 RepID=UPI00037A2428|nr:MULTISPECIES: hypothetical protein [unclassified Streptomyces]MYY06006.1 hypothetical protein [Streptomyces sp. SID4913]